MIVLPRDRLPAQLNERHATLRNYFCDKDADAVLTSSGWKLSLNWPTGAGRHVDPKLDVGLAWWGGEIGLGDMALQRRREGRIFRSLYDTWTLHSWSEWVSRAAPAALEGLVILHIDDHRDLGEPRLFTDGEQLVDSLTQVNFDLSDPNTVRDAIESGAIGMGSFMTPFLLGIPSCEVRHLCQPPKAKLTSEYKFCPVTVPDTILAPQRTRPGVRLHAVPGALGPGTYRITPSVDAWLEALPEGPILLHVDMDYFNNRYDGDSDWLSRTDILDPPIEAICAKIDEIVEALDRTGALSRIEDVAIAFSPGFFPAEFWARADTRLANGLRLVNGS